MALEKAKIIVLDDKGNEGDTIPVMFNPSEYTISKSSNYTKLGVINKNNKAIQYNNGEPAKLSMELFFNCDKVYSGFELIDEYDVRIYTQSLMNLVDKGSNNSPQLCKFQWGGFEFKGFVESITQKFTMFSESGMPIRAVVNIDFLEYKEEKNSDTNKAEKIDNQFKEDYKQLCTMADEYLKDPKKWREIADSNNVMNPRV